jgi:hypothetical protein
MLRLLQTSDVHLGARHPLLGKHATEQRQRQFLAFENAIEFAIATPVDLVIVAGDLFDSSVQSRASVERVAAALRKLVVARISTVILPGPGDAPGRASIYHAHDLAGLAGVSGDRGSIHVLTGDTPDVALPALGARLTSRFPATGLPDDGWRIGVVDRPSRPRDDEIAAAGVDYLAIGGPHAAASGRAASVSWGSSGAPELVHVGGEPSGDVLLVTLDEAAGRPTVERQRVGRTRAEHVEVDLPSVADRVALVDALNARADPDLVLDVDLVGEWRDDLDLDPTDLEAALVGSFFRIRVRNLGQPPLSPRPLPPAGTIAGSFLRDLEARIAQAETVGGGEAAAELREALRLGRRLLSGQEVER